MASTEAAAALRVEPLARLAEADLPLLEDLVAQSGWNQTRDDWGVFARHGHIGVVRDGGQRIVASGAVLPMGAALHGGSIAWISMILVTPAQRGRGLGRAVFDHCLRTAQAEGHIPMLDATPQGEPLYRQFGFEPLWRLTRWRRGAVGDASVALPQGNADVAALAALDAQALGFRRHGLLGELAGRPDSCCLRRPGAVGMVRAGRIAHQVGPLLATEPDAAAALLRQMAQGVAGAVMIDAPDDRTDFERTLRAAGFAPQRTFTRMALLSAGQRLPVGDSTLVHAIAGPEFA